MVTTATVTKSGNSAVVVLPAAWRKQQGIQFGDTVTVEYDSDSLVIRKRATSKEEKLQALDELLEFVESMPDVPWEDDSPEADKRLLGEILEEKYA